MFKYTAMLLVLLITGCGTDTTDTGGTNTGGTDTGGTDTGGTDTGGTDTGGTDTGGTDTGGTDTTGGTEIIHFTETRKFYYSGNNYTCHFMEYDSNNGLVRKFISNSSNPTVDGFSCAAIESDVLENELFSEHWFTKEYESDTIRYESTANNNILSTSCSTIITDNKDRVLFEKYYQSKSDSNVYHCDSTDESNTVNIQISTEYQGGKPVTLQEQLFNGIDIHTSFIEKDGIEYMVSAKDIGDDNTWMTADDFVEMYSVVQRDNESRITSLKTYFAKDGVMVDNNDYIAMVAIYEYDDNNKTFVIKNYNYYEDVDISEMDLNDTNLSVVNTGYFKYID